MSETITAALITAAVALFGYLILHYQTRKLAEREHAGQLELSRARLFFELECKAETLTFEQVLVFLHNAGDNPATIKEGNIYFESAKYPEAYEPHKLAGIKIEGGRHHLAKFPMKYGVSHPHGVPSPTVKVIGRAVYEYAKNRHDTAECEYHYDTDEGEFKKIR
jgi:hypothetical protein